jgi:hypothetical protein
MKITPFILIALLAVLPLSACTALVPIMPDPSIQVEAAEYARQFGVSQEEALRRLHAQEQIGNLNTDLENDHPETFAGLWIQHEPDYRIVIAFTEDGEKTARSYLAGKPWADLVEIRQHEFSLAELLGAEKRLHQVAASRTIPVTSSVDVVKNRVVVEVGNPDLFLQELQAANWQKRDFVSIQPSNPGLIPNSLHGYIDRYPNPSGGEIYFLRQITGSPWMEALLEGVLILDEHGCLRAETPFGNAPLIVWHHNFDLQISANTMEVIDGAGRVVARVDEPLSIGGGSALSPDILGLPIPACPGPYWMLGEISPLE